MKVPREEPCVLPRFPAMGFPHLGLAFFEANPTRALVTDFRRCYTSEVRPAKPAPLMSTATAGTGPPSKATREGRVPPRRTKQRPPPSDPEGLAKAPKKGRPTVTPEDALRRAMAAKTPAARARHAKSGLAQGPLSDRTVHAMLLRQLYLAFFEMRLFSEALTTASEASRLGVLPDVLEHDAARAAFATGDVDAAVIHLRKASRQAPPSRRHQHLWALGSTLYLAGRYDLAEAALAKAMRWATGERPLYRAHLTLARIAAGRPPPDLRDVIETLASAPCGQGYGAFVLGHLAFASGDWSGARRYLTSFIKRTNAGRVALSIALEGELRLARETLAKMDHN